MPSTSAGEASGLARPLLDLADVQGNILRGYRLQHVRHLVLQVDRPSSARAVLGSMADGNADGNADAPQLTTGAEWTVKPDYCLNLGITFAGLRALGVPDGSLATFPMAFKEGMISRASKLGDFGASAPVNWSGRLNESDLVHLVVTIHAPDDGELERLSDVICSSEGGRAFAKVSHFDGTALPDNKVHFGYRDSISQPRFEGIHDPDAIPDPQPLAPLGTVLLGYPTFSQDLTWTVPEPAALGRNGSFNAFRVLAQDVASFESFIQMAAAAHPEELTPELVAAKLCGRWRNGVPLIQSPAGPPPEPGEDDRSLNNFDYDELAAGVCPTGAHIRRCNPRSSRIVQRGSGDARRLVRRGIPYGPAFDPAHPDDAPRGLLANFICASIEAQFEAIQFDWLNLGLQDPRLSGSNDALTGANDPATSYFEIPVDEAPSIMLRGIPRFVNTRGGAYTFLPSPSALRWIASLSAG
jgi:deferrochelatase/peroxidase EfeB